MSALTDALQQAGMNAMKAGQLQEAVSVLQQAAAADPNAARTFAYLGAAYCQMCDYESARHAFGRAVQIEPQSARARFNLGVAHNMAGDNEAARVCFESALQLAPDYAQATEALAALPPKDLSKIDIGSLSAPSAKIHVHGAQSGAGTDPSVAQPERVLSPEEVARLSTPASGHIHLMGAQDTTSKPRDD